MCDCFAERFCSLVSRAVGEDPGGTATHYRQYILVELPLPWPKDPTQAEAFPHGLERVMSAAPGAKARLLFIAPDAEYSRAGQARVISFRRPSDGLVAGFDREEHLVPVGQVAALAEALLQGSVGVGQRPAIRDMLVCTHGSTDAACGRFGYPLYETLRRRYAGPGLRVWRVSHIGGHRFAPTLLDFPEGRCWGHLEPGDLDALVQRSGPVDALMQRYRGWAALPTPYEQVAERAVFQQVGWGWAGRHVSSRLLSLDDAAGRAEVRIECEGGSYAATVEVVSRLRTMSSSRGDTTEVKQYRVSLSQGAPAR